jgi:predicted secreted protein
LSPIPWGDHGWVPRARLREPAGQVLTVPAVGGKLLVYAEVLTPATLATPDRLECTAWVVVNLKKFGVLKGHVQQDWLRLGKEPVTIHDTKRWGTAQMRLADTSPDKPLAVEMVGRGVLSLTPPEGTPAAANRPGIRPKTTQTVELPREAGASRVVKYTLQGLPFDETLDLYLALRVESLGRVLVVGPEANGKTVTVKDVDTVVIRLPGEDPNKAAWDITSVKGKAVETLGRVEFEGDTANVFGIALNGTFKAFFRVRQKGQATAALEYRPLTEEKKPIAKSFKVALDVQSAAQPPAAQAAESNAKQSRR